MAINKFGFAFRTEPGLSEAIQKFKEIEKLIVNHIAGRDYGSGVKAVYIGIILIDIEHVRKFAKPKPSYKAGKYELREGVVSLWLEDTLEFDVVPKLSEVRSAISVEELAQALLRAIKSAYLCLQKVSIPDFDMMRFLSDLDEALSSIGTDKRRNRFGMADTTDQLLLSNDELNEIRSRCERATPGPWKSYIEGREEMSGSDFIRKSGEDIYLTGATKDDQDFIAHARQDIPKLIAEIERLKRSSTE